MSVTVVWCSRIQKGCIPVDVTLLPPGLSIIVLVLPLPGSVDLPPPPYERLASSADCSEGGLIFGQREEDRAEKRTCGRQGAISAIFFTVHAATYVKVLEHTPNFVKAPSEIFDK